MADQEHQEDQPHRCRLCDSTIEALPSNTVGNMIDTDAKFIDHSITIENRTYPCEGAWYPNNAKFFPDVNEALLTLKESETPPDPKKPKLQEAARRKDSMSLIDEQFAQYVQEEFKQPSLGAAKKTPKAKQPLVTGPTCNDPPPWCFWHNTGNHEWHNCPSATMEEATNSEHTAAQYDFNFYELEGGRELQAPVSSKINTEYDLIKVVFCWARDELNRYGDWASMRDKSIVILYKHCEEKCSISHTALLSIFHVAIMANRMAEHLMMKLKSILTNFCVTSANQRLKNKPMFKDDNCFEFESIVQKLHAGPTEFNQWEHPVLPKPALMTLVKAIRLWKNEYSERKAAITRIAVEMSAGGPDYQPATGGIAYDWLSLILDSLPEVEYTKDLRCVSFPPVDTMFETLLTSHNIVIREQEEQ